MIAGGLESNEFVSLLSWVLQTYPGVELLQHPDLRIDAGTLGPLLTDDNKEKLLKVCVMFSSVFLLANIVRALCDRLLKVYDIVKV